MKKQGRYEYMANPRKQVTDGQTDEQTEKRTDKQTDRWIERPTDALSYRVDTILTTKTSAEAQEERRKETENGVRKNTIKRFFSWTNKVI